MEPNRFLFKLVAILLQYIFVVIIFIPIVYFFHLLKYNFNLSEIYFIRILFFAIAFALPFVIANAFSFANYEKNDLAFYLKSNQKHKVIIDMNSTDLLNLTANKLTKQPFWTLKNQSTDSLEFIKSNLILKDKVYLKTRPISDSQVELTISSRPKLRFIFLDFARNYQNIVDVLLATKNI